MSLPSSRIRKKHSKEFKFQVALEAVKEEKTIATICREFSIHDSQVNLWKRKLKESGPKIFEESYLRSNRESELEAQIKKLNEYVGELSIENRFFKKNFSL